MTDDDLVMGEPRALLREALLCTRTRRRPDGAVELEGEIPPELADPFVRALERTCEELAEGDRARGAPVREGGHLRASALVALALRVTDASWCQRSRAADTERP